MALQSNILAGNARLEAVSTGAPSVKRRLPDDDEDAVRRIQNALVALGIPLPNSFPNGPNGAPDGVFGTETFNGVQRFQKTAFPASPSEWDGRVGKKTLEEMDARLPKKASPVIQSDSMSALAEKDRLTSLKWAQAAVGSLRTAREFLQTNGAPPKPGQATSPTVRIAFQALETHYHFSTVVGSKIATVDFITSQFGKAIGVLAASNQFFIDDTTSQESLNGTPAHVPFGKGKVNFTPAFRERNNATGEGFGPMCRAAMVLHEPIHITDHPRASTVATHVGETSPQYARQTAANQIHNAHSYASFGQHCFFGSDTRFGIGRPSE
jgi:peptidoglycan hydrolase-like protein with peptidoglycan-binding domain